MSETMQTEISSDVNLGLDLLASKIKMKPAHEIQKHMSPSSPMPPSPPSIKQQSSPIQSTRYNNDDDETSTRESYYNRNTNQSHEQQYHMEEEQPADNNYAKIDKEYQEYLRIPKSHQKGKRIKILLELKGYEKRGYVLSKSYNVDSDYYDMLCEVESIKDMKSRDNGIGLCQKFLLASIQGLEYLNERYDPFSLRLKGLHESIYTNIDDYNEVLAEIYDKYRSSGKRIEPEIRLVMMLIAAGASQHTVHTQLVSMPEPLKKMAVNQAQSFASQAFKNDDDNRYQRPIVPPRQPPPIFNDLPTEPSRDQLLEQIKAEHLKYPSSNNLHDIMVPTSESQAESTSRIHMGEKMNELPRSTEAESVISINSNSVSRRRKKNSIKF